MRVRQRGDVGDDVLYRGIVGERRVERHHLFSVGVLLGVATDSQFEIAQLPHQVPARLAAQLRCVQLQIPFRLLAVAGTANRIGRPAGRGVAGGLGPRLRIGRLPGQPGLKIIRLLHYNAPAHREMRHAAQLFA